MKSQASRGKYSSSSSSQEYRQNPSSNYPKDAREERIGNNLQVEKYPNLSLSEYPKHSRFLTYLVSIIAVGCVLIIAIGIVLWEFSKNNILCWAVDNSHIGMIELSLDLGANPNTLDHAYFGEPQPVLVVAAHQPEYSDMIRMLLKHGANPNAQDLSDGTTALSQVIQYANFHENASVIAYNTKIYDTVRLFLDHGADPNLGNEAGRKRSDTITLFLAVYRGNSDLVRLLLDHGANPNIINQYGDTPLISATNNDNIAIVRLLLNHGADVNAKGTRDETALKHAHNSEIESLLIAAGGKKS